MGGYGAIKLAMKTPDVFGAIYGTSSCCLIYPPPASNQKGMLDGVGHNARDPACVPADLIE